MDAQENIVNPIYCKIFILFNKILFTVKKKNSVLLYILSQHNLLTKQNENILMPLGTLKAIFVKRSDEHRFKDFITKKYIQNKLQ